MTISDLKPKTDVEALNAIAKQLQYIVHVLDKINLTIESKSTTLEQLVAQSNKLEENER